MKTLGRFFVSLALIFSAASAAPAAAQEQPQQRYGALERGYRTGYSDGYQSGWGDQLRRAPADHAGKEDYRRADRAYIADYGTLEDYRDGYRQGYEVGYRAGYAREGFDSSLPAGGVSRRGVGADGGAAGSGGRADDADDDSESASGGGRLSPSQVPSNTTMTVELLNRLSTDVSQRGDRFEARVVEPQEFEGAIVGGRLADVQRAGKARGRALLQIDFDRIKMPGSNEWTEFNAQVTEILPSGDTGADEVDPEGGVRGRSTTKEDVAKVGGAAGVGAIIGAIAGGGKGAAIGAVIGAGAGTAGVMTQRGKDIRFEPGQQLRIRSTGRR